MNKHIQAALAPYKHTSYTLEVYTDAAIHKNHLGSAFMVQLVDAKDFMAPIVLHMARKKYPTMPQERNVYGELHAVILALKWYQGFLKKVDQKTYYCRNLTICSDYIGVRHYLDESWQPRSTIANQLLHLWHQVHRFLGKDPDVDGPIQTRHTKGHTGDPGNEFADCLAKMAALEAFIQYG